MGDEELRAVVCRLALLERVEFEWGEWEDMLKSLARHNRGLMAGATRCTDSLAQLQIQGKQRAITYAFRWMMARQSRLLRTPTKVPWPINGGMEALSRRVLAAVDAMGPIMAEVLSFVEMIDPIPKMTRPEVVETLIDRIVQCVMSMTMGDLGSVLRSRGVMPLVKLEVLLLVSRYSLLRFGIKHGCLPHSSDIEASVDTKPALSTRHNFKSRPKGTKPIIQTALRRYMCLLSGAESDLDLDSGVMTIRARHAPSDFVLWVPGRRDIMSQFPDVAVAGLLDAVSRSPEFKSIVQTSIGNFVASTRDRAASIIRLSELIVQTICLNAGMQADPTVPHVDGLPTKLLNIQLSQIRQMMRILTVIGAWIPIPVPDDVMSTCGLSDGPYKRWDVLINSTTMFDLLSDERPTIPPLLISAVIGAPDDNV